MNIEKEAAQQLAANAKQEGKTLIPANWPAIQHKQPYTVRTLDREHHYMMLNCGTSKNKALFILADKGHLLYPVYQVFEIELGEDKWRPMTLWKKHKLGDFGEIPAFEFRFFSGPDLV